MKTGSKFIITVPAGFEPEAKKEIEGLVPGSKASSLFFKGNLLVESSWNETEAVTKIKESETLYVGRVFPIDAKITITSEKDSILRLYEMLEGKLEPEYSFAVRCQRRGTHNFSSRDVERELGAKLEIATGATVDLQNPDKIVVVQIFQNIAYLGLTDAKNLIVKPIQVSRKYAKGERPFTRAEHKLREALETFNVRIKPDFEVLDLGAAPGGWTKVLARSAKKVVAVDPADLDPKVAGLPNVVHLRCRAEKITSDVGLFDLVTNDTNLAPAESARLMVDVAACLKKGGFAVMTVKFVTRNRKKHIEEAIQILKAQYANFKVRRLPHNRYETTLFMQKA
jgi:tRNA(Ser,Leu) C12 N-acetylase TAN1/23S rRNA U2552 (ribose-2'-O)-methylase RlmE/FtsJ